MKAYIFNKSDRRVFNSVVDVNKINGVSISSDTETFILNDDEDFVVTDTGYKTGDVIPESENNKTVKTEIELLREKVAMQETVIEELMFTIIPELTGGGI